MFDFLIEQKRNIIINHPELGKPYFSGEIDKKTFIDNLRAFASQIGITPEEIERIRKIIEEISSNEVKELAHRLFYEAGFEVYIWLGNRDDLNDWPLFEYDAGYSYIKAVHRLQGYSENEIFPRPYHGTKNILNSRIPFNKILPSISALSHQVKVDAPHGSRMARFAETYWGLKNPGSLRLANGFETEPRFFLRDKPYPHSLKCWMLCNQLELDETKEFMHNTDKIIKVRRKGLLGLARLKEKKIIQQPVYRIKRTLKTAKYMPLNTIMQTEDSSPAYLMHFWVQKTIYEHFQTGRKGATDIWVIAGKELIEKTASFLLRYPDLYYDVVRGFIPRSMFPNVNKGILSPPFLNTKGIVFQNYTDGIQISVE